MVAPSEEDLSKRRQINGKSRPDAQMVWKKDGDGEPAASISVLQGGSRTNLGTTREKEKIPNTDDSLEDAGKNGGKRMRINDSNHRSTQRSDEHDAESEASASTSVLRRNHPGQDSIANKESWRVSERSSVKAEGENMIKVPDAIDDAGRQSSLHRPPFFLVSHIQSLAKVEQGEHEPRERDKVDKRARLVHATTQQVLSICNSV